MGTTKTRKQCSTDNVGVFENIERFSANFFWLMNQNHGHLAYCSSGFPKLQMDVRIKNHKGFKNPLVFSGLKHLRS